MHALCHTNHTTTATFSTAESITGSVCYIIFFRRHVQKCRRWRKWKVWRIFIRGSKGFPRRVAILAKWYIRRKWWIWRTFTKVLAKLQMRWQRGSLKEAILTKKANLAKMAKMAHPRQSLANVPKTCQRLPFESGDFGENGKCCEHPPVLGKIQMRWKKGPLKVVIFTKMANMVRFRHSLSYKSNKTDRIQTFRIGDGRGEGGGSKNNFFGSSGLGLV